MRPEEAPELFPPGASETILQQLARIEGKVDQLAARVTALEGVGAQGRSALSDLQALNLNLQNALQQVQATLGEA